MALFCDFENVALGVRDAQYEKIRHQAHPGAPAAPQRAPSWSRRPIATGERYKGFKATMHGRISADRNPACASVGQNSADIRLVVDALDLCYTKSHVNTFVIISGDSDFRRWCPSCARTTNR